MFRKILCFILAGLFFSCFSGLSIAATPVTQNNGPQEYFETVDESGQSLILKIAPSTTATVTSAASCIRYTNTVTGGPTAVDTAEIAYGPYTTNCSGYHSGSLTNLSSAFLDLYLQKLISGAWQNVASGYINYNGQPGTYRWVVMNQPYSSSVGYWSLNYSFPM
jgi:hypothetical protein